MTDRQWSRADLTATFGDRVRLERLAPGMTQDALGTEVGLTRSSIANMEADRQNISLASACAIADALGTTVGALLGEIDPPPRPVVDVRHVVRQVVEASAGKLARDLDSAIRDATRSA